jgi:hypothetical protein
LTNQSPKLKTTRRFEKKTLLFRFNRFKVISPSGKRRGKQFNSSRVIVLKGEPRPRKQLNRFRVTRFLNEVTRPRDLNIEFTFRGLFCFDEKKNMKKEKNDNEIFTDREAAAYLRIGRTTLWRERKKGKITFCRSAAKIVYTKKDLEKYLESTKRVAFSCAA